MNPKLTPKWPPLRGDLLAFCKAKRGREADLVRYLGVPQPTISAWLHGRQEPGAEAALQLREWLLDENRKQAVGGSHGGAARGGNDQRDSGQNCLRLGGINNERMKSTTP